MNQILEDDLALIIGGNLADDGAALAAQGVVDLRGSRIWEGSWFVGGCELWVGAAEFYGGWAAETISKTVGQYLTW